MRPRTTIKNIADSRLRNTILISKVFHRVSLTSEVSNSENFIFGQLRSRVSFANTMRSVSMSVFHILKLTTNFKVIGVRTKSISTLMSNNFIRDINPLKFEGKTMRKNSTSSNGTSGISITHTVDTTMPNKAITNGYQQIIEIFLGKIFFHREIIAQNIKGVK